MAISLMDLVSEGAAWAFDPAQYAVPRWQTLVASAAGFAMGLGIVAAHAEETAGPAYVVTYIEVLPKAEKQTAELLGKQMAEMRKKPDNLGYVALQRNSPARHFAIVEFWKSPASLEGARASEANKEFRNVLTPLLAAPYDERPHKAMLADPRTQAALLVQAPQAVYVVTHVDVIPPKLEEGIAATKALFAPGSAEPGNIAFDVLQQNSRLNHMTLFEIWKDADALEAHESSDFVRHYRQTLLPLAGSLYDQRVYHPLN
jgi:quinol monooxygenase YgiN